MNDRYSRTIIFNKQFLSKNFESSFEKTILITGDEKILQTYNGVLMIKTLVNLTSRFLENIFFSIPSSCDELKTELVSLAKKCGTNVVNEIPSNIDIVISVGNASVKGTNTIRINSNGWIAYLSYNNQVHVAEEPMENPIGAMGAACLGTAEAYKILLKHTGCEKKWIHYHPTHLAYSFLTYSTNNDNREFPKKIKLDDNILLVGAGAVGNAFVYSLLNIKNVEGGIFVVDQDKFDESNLNRCVLMFTDNKDEHKSIVLSRHSTSTLKIIPHVMSFEDFKNNIGLKHPIIISTVDNNEARYNIQSELPRLIFHGATGSNISAVSIIKFLENACFCCIFDTKKSYEESIADETGIPVDEVTKTILQNKSFSIDHLNYMKQKWGYKAQKYEACIGSPFIEVYPKEICGKMGFETSDGRKNGSISFVSFFSGLCVASELIKNHTLDMGEYPMLSHLDFLQFNLFLPELLQPYRRKKNPSCVLQCCDPKIQKIFSDKWPECKRSDS